MVNYEQLLRQLKQQQLLQHIDGINSIKISMGEKPLVSRTKVEYLFLLIIYGCPICKFSQLLMRYSLPQ